MKAIDIGDKRLWNSLLIAFVSFSIFGCIPLPPPDLSLSKMPVVSGQGCVITAIRTRQFNAGTYYITFDGLNVAKLNNGEYTRFLISEGRHTIGVTNQFWGVAIIAGVVAGTPASAIHKEVEMECHSGETFSYGLKLKYGWDVSDADRTSFQQLTDSDEDFRVEDKILVPAGIPKKQ